MRLGSALALLLPLACGQDPRATSPAAEIAAAPAVAPQPAPGTPQVQEARPDRSAPLYLLPTPPAPRRIDRRPGSFPLRKDGARPRGEVQAPLVPLAPAPAAPMPAPILSFEGIGQGFPLPGGGSYTVTAIPPDPMGDIGPNHFLQAVNTDLAAFVRGTGAVLGPIPLNTLWSGFSDPVAGTVCADTNEGDPVVLYDSLADRWFVSQLAFRRNPGTGQPGPPFHQCVAVSASGDPSGGWVRYVFGPFRVGNTDVLNDYPKFGLWPDAYYASYNLFDLSTTPETFRGVRICALEREQMLAGATARQACVDLGTSHFSPLPADLDGPLAPPPGTPGLFASVDPAPGGRAWNLYFWRLSVTWGASATVTAPAPDVIPVPDVPLVCPSIAGSECVPQSGTTTLLDAIDWRLMFRLAYRNLGWRESLVAAHTVDAGLAAGNTAVRWYELRSQSGLTLSAAAPALQQMGTLAPDSAFRWVPSAAMDQMGNLAVGYSHSSTADHPGIRYSGRLWSDPPGQLSQTERALFTGNGSQTSSRWGDYTALTVDPIDDCTFWYVNEHVPSTGGPWRTRIGTFRFPTCPPGFDIGGVAGPVPPGAPLSLTLTARDALGAAFSDYAGMAVLASSDPQAVLPADPVPFTGGVATAAVTLVTQGQQTVEARDVLHPNFRGTLAVEVRQPAAPPAPGGCGCGQGPADASSLLALLALLRRSRRPRGRGDGADARA